MAGSERVSEWLASAPKAYTKEAGMSDRKCGAWMRDTRDSGEHVCTLPVGHVGSHEEQDGTPHAIMWESGPSGGVSGG